MMRARRALERLRNTFWALPAIGIAFAIGLAFLLPTLDDSLTLPEAIAFSGGAETARALLQVIATVAVSVAGISFSVIVVALVLASQQLSPRVMRTFQRDPLNQGVLGAFLATAAYSLFALAAIGQSGDAVPEVTVTIAMALAAISLGLFVLFLHHLVRALNASAIIKRIAAEGHRAIDAPYPAGTGEEPRDVDAAERAARSLMDRGTKREVTAPRAGYLASVEGAAIVAAAEACGGFAEQRVMIGDFTATGGVLAVVWAPGPSIDRFATRVQRAFVLDEERLVDDDIAFPLRQLADIALRGLSPGINDPTTAENAMNSVTDSLVRLARQPESAMLRVDSGGVPRMRAEAPSLDALVRLGFDQVRRDGAARPAFAVRLLELLAALRALGGSRARACAEIDRQALAVRDHTTALAEIPSDGEMIKAAYERLHAPFTAGRGAGTLPQLASSRG